MLKNCSILVTLAMATAIAASVIPRSGLIDNRAIKAAANATYVGNNLYLGKRSGDDWLHRTDRVTANAVLNRVVNATLTFTTYFNLTYVAAIDLANSTLLGAYPTLVAGGPGHKTTSLLFTSKVGKPINFTVSSYVRY